MRHLYLTALPNRTLFAALDEEFLPERAYLSHRDGEFKFSTEETEVSREINDKSLLSARETMGRVIRRMLGEEPEMWRVEERDDMPRGRTVEVYGRGSAREVFVGKVEYGNEVVLASKGADSDTVNDATRTAKHVLRSLLERVIALYYS